MWLIKKIIDRYRIDEDASDESKISALIRCVLHTDPDLMTDEEFYRAWFQVKYFMSLAYQVKFD